MVVKLLRILLNFLSGFESRVILDGSQTTTNWQESHRLFESRVILDGSQTFPQNFLQLRLFESRVILDGSQTASQIAR